MTDLPGGEDAARAIHRAMSRRVRITGGGETNKSILAVRTHAPAGGLMADESARQLAFEIRKEDLAGRPVEGDTISENDGAGPVWHVIECDDLDEVDAWQVMVAA